MNNTSVKCTVLSIIETVGDWSRVVLEANTFNAIMQSVNARYNKERPLLRWSTELDSDGKGFRVFNIRGIIVKYHSNPTGLMNISKTNGQEYPQYKPIFHMRKEDALACKSTIEEIKANTPNVGFRLADFNLNTVASA